MPLYEYRCPKGHTQTFSLKVGNASKQVACLLCDGWAERVLTVPAVRFKGEGFTKKSA